MEKSNETKPSPREALAGKDLIGFEIVNTETDATASKTVLAKNGKVQPTWVKTARAKNGKTQQPSWSRA